MHDISQGLVFPIEHEMINILLFKCCIVVITATLPHHCGTKVALDIMKITERLCSNKTLFAKTGEKPDLAHGGDFAHFSATREIVGRINK